MSKRVLRCVVAVALALPLSLTSQTAGAPGVMRERPRSSYDPAAASNANRQQKPGGVATVMAQINPCNQNYGFWLDQAHLDLYQETLHNFLWWSLLVMSVAFAMAGIYICWLWYQMDLLLEIASNTIALLFNAHVESWNRADTLVDKYNALMNRFNALYIAEQEAKKRAARLEEAEKQQGGAHVEAALTVDTQYAQLTTDARVAVPVTGPPVESAKKRPGRPKGTSDVKTAEGTLFDDTDRSPDAQLIDQLTRERDALKAQVRAQDEKVANLRNQVNRAHDRLVSGQRPQESGN